MSKVFGGMQHHRIAQVCVGNYECCYCHISLGLISPPLPFSLPPPPLPSLPPWGWTNHSPPIYRTTSKPHFSLIVCAVSNSEDQNHTRTSAHPGGWRGVDAASWLYQDCPQEQSTDAGQRPGTWSPLDKHLLLPVFVVLSLGSCILCKC